MSPSPSFLPDSLHDLMPYRVREILLVSNSYDAFILEKDGQLIEKIFQNYLELNLIFIPRIVRASSCQEAEQLILSRHFDLVITMMDLPDATAFELAAKLRNRQARLPVILLINDPTVINTISENRDSAAFDGIFFWSGDSALFFAIMKYIEDKLNVVHDIEITGFIKIILLVEDSVQYYSGFLPDLYSELMKQIQQFTKYELTDFQKILRLRTRPKILLATTFEQAAAIVKQYENYILGVITDVSFKKDNQVLLDTGFLLAQYVRSIKFDIPIIVMSAEEKNRAIAETQRLIFLNKQSHGFHDILVDFINLFMGLGDFVCRLPDGTEIGKASNMKELQRQLEIIPEESLLFHSSRNHISLWLAAHGEHEIAFKIRPLKLSDFKEDPQALRHFLVNSIATYRDKKQTGVVVKYQKNEDWDSRFIEIGSGSLGGKARGVAFINYMLASTEIRSKFNQQRLLVPKTVTLATDIFDAFVTENDLQRVFSFERDEDVAETFVSAALPESLKEDLRSFLRQSSYPLSIRSSSLLEDSQFLPFAGIYSTHMIPNIDPDIEVRLNGLLRAIKLVYASVYFKRSKAYIQNSPYKLDEEKMGVLIQQVVGSQYNDLYYPIISGVAQSYNYYPFSYIKPEDGVAQIALGLGKFVIDGGQSVRFCPLYPDILPQFSSVEDTLKNSQKYFYALNIQNREESWISDTNMIVKRPIRDALAHGTLDVVAGVYDIDNQQIQYDKTRKGPRVITFANILKHGQFPLAEILRELVNILKQSMSKDLEMEFAVDLFGDSSGKSVFYALQVRPLLIQKGDVKIEESELRSERVICSCKKALGNGIIPEVRDLIFVDPDRFDPAKTQLIAAEVGAWNEYMRLRNRGYLLIGIGRWGTQDPWLGIPVQWEQISNVRAMVETQIEGFYSEPSQGSHFFQNITSRMIGYFSLDAKEKDDFLNWNYLKSLPPKGTCEFVRQVELDKPLLIKINGKTRQGIILAG